MPLSQYEERLQFLLESILEEIQNSNTVNNERIAEIREREREADGLNEALSTLQATYFLRKRGFTVIKEAPDGE